MKTHHSDALQRSVGNSVHPSDLRLAKISSSTGMMADAEPAFHWGQATTSHQGLPEYA